MVQFEFHPLHPGSDITNASFYGLTTKVNIIGVETTVDLVIIGIGMSLFPVLINCGRKRATVLSEFNGTMA